MHYRFGKISLMAPQQACQTLILVSNIITSKIKTLKIYLH